MATRIRPFVATARTALQQSRSLAPNIQFTRRFATPVSDNGTSGLTPNALPDEHLEAVLAHFRAPIRFACGYGSGVFKQASYGKDAQPMLDLILGVTHTQHWHSLNINQNRNHYSAAARLGSWTVAKLQDNFGASVYYNTHVEVAGRKIKYGVVQMDRLVRDLENWETMYLAGRFHKPINVLRSDPRVQLANDANRLAALRVALLLLPNEFSIMDLFTTIVGLSYSGDFRTMIGAENPNKIRNIASAQAPLLFDIYKPLLDLSNDVVILRGGENWVQATDPRTRARLISALPSSFRKRVYAGFGGIADGNVMANSVAASGDLEHLVKSALKKTIAYPALMQSIKGIATAGIVRSAIYSLEKLRKGRQK